MDHQLDCLHCCHSDLGKWSRAGALFASSKSVWSARLTARKSDTETEAAWKPKAFDCATQAATNHGINLFKTDFFSKTAAPTLHHLLIDKRSQATDKV